MNDTPITSIAVDPIARENAVQAAIDKTKAEAAVAALDAAAAQPEVVPAPPAPSHGVVVSTAPVPVDLEPSEPVEAAPAPIEQDEVLPTVAEFRALQVKVADLEAHVEELVNHLAQSFGGEYAVKKSRMGV